MDQEPRPELAMDARYNRQTLAVMRRCLQADSNCVDAGCHEGVILKEMLLVAPRGRHFAFEPLPEQSALLRRSFAAYPNVSIFELALSDVAGTSVFFNVETDPSYSGLRKRSLGPGEHRISELQVDTELLDHMLPPGLPIRFIKIDVEGAELWVMRGAKDTIRNYKPIIVFEHGMGAADKYGTTPEQVHEFLSGCGLKTSLMESWLSGGPPLASESFVEEFRTGRNFYFIAHP